MAAKVDVMKEFEYTSGNMDPQLDLKFIVQKGQKIFPVTHRKAIYGLAPNSLVLSESLDVDVDEVDQTITINPAVEDKIIEINISIENLQNTINTTISNAITNLENRMDNMLYAASDKPAGVALSAKKLQTPFQLSVNKHVTGSATIDGSGNVNMEVTLTGKYAGSDVLNGDAYKAKKLSKTFNLALTGAVTGNVNMDGSGNVSLATSVNHNHDSLYLKLTGGTINGGLTVTGAETVNGILTCTNVANFSSNATISGTMTATNATVNNVLNYRGYQAHPVIVAAGGPGNLIAGQVWAW